MKQPNSLKKDGAIGFVAPSFGCNISPYKECFENALKKFQKMGYSTVLGPNCYRGDGIGISAPPKECALEFMEFYKNNDTDVLFSCGGGELACEILDGIDFEALREAPAKWFCGYSDNTNLIFPLTTISHHMAIYGLCGSTFGMEPWYQNHFDILGIMQGTQRVFHGYDMYEKESLKSEENPLAFYHLTDKKELRLYQNGAYCDEVEFNGRMIGGCIDCLVTLQGTKYDQTKEFLEAYKEHGFIWFLESCELSAVSIRRAMWQMEHGGWFQYCKGMIIGRPLNGEEAFGVDRYTAVLPTVDRLKIPVIFDADLGHVSPAMPFISGALATVKAWNNELIISYDL